uniref:Large ribosomal subunit protein uL22c n=1 Tax=Kalanchoe fedtschenkoi TaxID=63787 RepID=A0A7N0VF75_KALFE
MAVWQRRIQSLVRQIGSRVEYSLSQSSALSSSSSSRLTSSLLRGDVASSEKIWSASSANFTRPFHSHLQQMNISSTRELSADSSEQAIPSPLTPLLTSTGGSEEPEKIVKKPETVQAVLKKIKQSPKKVNLIAALVRGMRVEDALLQLQVTIKRASKTVYQVIHSARANATHNYGMDPDRLLIAEAFVGKGLFKKRIAYHSKGRSGVKVRAECRLTVVLRETTPEEEAEIARLRVHKFRKLTKREKRLVPHKLIETTPVWDRKARKRSASSDMAA